MKTRSTIFALLLAGNAAAAANWTDRGEYDIALAIRAEALPKKKLELLDAWKLKYANTELRQVRRELYLSTYQALSDNAGMLATAKEMLADQPGNYVGLYWTTLLVPVAKDTSAATLSLGEKAASRLLDVKKPSAINDSDWRKQKPKLDLLAHRTLGWIQWQRGDYPAATEEFTKYLQQAPEDAEIATWFGTVLALQKKPESPSLALWQLARASTLHGEGGLPDGRQRQISGLVERYYTSYHGDASGLNQLLASAAAAPFPPPDFTIESAAMVAARKQLEELDKTNPQLAAWLRIRQQLESSSGDKYFADTLHNAPLPRMKGTVIRFSPPKKPEVIVVGVRDSTAEEIVLKLNGPFAREAEPGTVIEFEGIVDSFSHTPFALTVVADRDKIDGWPGTRRRQ